MTVFGRSLTFVWIKVFYPKTIFPGTQTRFLRQTLNHLRRCAFAPTTWRTRKSQWKCFFEFCASIGVAPLPADVETVSLFIAHLSLGREFSTVNNYVGSIVSLHHVHDLQAPDLSHFKIKQALAGLKQTAKNTQTGRKVFFLATWFLYTKICTLYRQTAAGRSGLLVLWPFSAFYVDPTYF